MAQVVADDEPFGFAWVEDGSAAVGVDGRGIKFFTQAVVERQPASGAELVACIEARVVQPVVAAGVPRLSKREKRAAQEKIGEGVAGGRARAGDGVAAERKNALAEILDQIEEPQTAIIASELQRVPAVNGGHIVSDLESMVFADLRLKDVAIAHVGEAGHVDGRDAVVRRPRRARDAE